MWRFWEGWFADEAERRREDRRTPAEFAVHAKPLDAAPKTGHMHEMLKSHPCD